MSTLNMLLNMAYTATGLIPGMGETQGKIKVAREILPDVQEVYEYFQTEEGKRALAQLNKLFKAISQALPEENQVFAPPPVMEGHYSGWKWVWVGGLEGWAWQRVGGEDE